jgi:serine/threonine protein kinase
MAKRRGSGSGLCSGNYGQLNKHNPYVGYFIYAPSLASLHPSPHSDSHNIVPFYEINHRKYIQQHPYTGSFHYAPGIYGKLHQLEKYRQDNQQGKIASKDEKQEEDEKGNDEEKNKKIKFESNLITQSADDLEMHFHRKRNLKYFVSNRNTAKPNEEIKMSLTLKEWGSLPQLPEPHSPAHHDPSQLALDESTWQVQNPSGIKSYHLIPETTTDCTQALSDHYILFPNHLLGEGSYARIYLGKKIGTSLYVAIKVIPLSSSDHSASTNSSTLHELPELIENEIQIQSRLCHRHVVNIDNVFKSKKHLYIVMDYCSGGSLDQMLALRNRLSEDEARVIAYQLLDGLCYLHQHGVLHGDIKPGNIMFQPQANVLHSRAPHRHPQSHLPNLSSHFQMNPIDLLYEKKLREGKLMISINHAPVFDHLEEGGERERQQIDQLILEDMKTAVLHKRCVQRHEIKSIPSQSNQSKTLDVIARDSLKAIGSEEQPRPPPRRRSASETLNLSSSFSIKKVEFLDLEKCIDSITRSKNSHDIEEEMTSHQRIRYKSPYGLLLKLCDFGLSQSIPNIKFFHSTGNISKAPYTNPCGTQGYLSPEIIECSCYGLAADLWAVGILLYKSLSGNYPFIPFDSYQHKEVSFNGIIWKKISIECKELIRALLTVNENHRITALQALHHHWFREILLISKIIVPSDEISISLAHTKEASF